MKTPSDPSDPLLQSLAEETADLPLRAAAEARRACTQRLQHRRQFAVAITVLVCGFCVWQMVSHRDSIAKQNIATSSTQPRAQLITRTEEQARNQPLPMPEGLTKDQENVVKAARGLPLLLVRDSSGKVARIHFFER
jgi:hypothetical protein